MFAVKYEGTEGLLTAAYDFRDACQAAADAAVYDGLTAPVIHNLNGVWIVFLQTACATGSEDGAVQLIDSFAGTLGKDGVALCSDSVGSFLVLERGWGRV